MPEAKNNGVLCEVSLEPKVTNVGVTSAIHMAEAIMRMLKKRAFRDGVPIPHQEAYKTAMQDVREAIVIVTGEGGIDKIIRYGE